MQNSISDCRSDQNDCWMEPFCRKRQHRSRSYKMVGLSLIINWNIVFLNNRLIVYQNKQMTVINKCQKSEIKFQSVNWKRNLLSPIEERVFIGFERSWGIGVVRVRVAVEIAGVSGAFYGGFVEFHWYLFCDEGFPVDGAEPAVLFNVFNTVFKHTEPLGDVCSEEHFDDGFGLPAFKR